MRHFVKSCKRVLLSSTLVIVLAACGTSGRAPVNFLELAPVVAPLPGTQGKTADDQRRIDLTVANGCNTGILGSSQCDLQTRASRDRKAELKQNGG